MCIISRWYICCGVYESRVVQLITLLTSSVSAGSWSVCQDMETFIFLLVLLKSFIKLWFRLGHFSLQNPKNFRMREPFKFSYGSFFNPYETVNKYSNATLLRQIVSQNLRQKTLGFLRLIWMCIQRCRNQFLVCPLLCTKFANVFCRKYRVCQKSIQSQ